jgi:hypothetical protein
VAATNHEADEPPLSVELERWLESDHENTLGELVDMFEEKSFAILFVVLLAVPALPLPTGGATHVFELVAMLGAVQLVLGRTTAWLPQRLRRRQIGTSNVTRLVRLIRRLERFSRPRLRFLFDHRLSNAIFGLLVLGGSLGAFFAPPFSGLDTLPALAVVLVSLGFLLEDVVLVVIGLIVGTAGVLLEIFVGGKVLHWVRHLF